MRGPCRNAARASSFIERPDVFMSLTWTEEDRKGLLQGGQTAIRLLFTVSRSWSVAESAFSLSFEICCLSCSSHLCAMQAGWLFAMDLERAMDLRSL